MFSEDSAIKPHTVQVLTDESIESIGDEIEIIRVALDMTQKEFADAISVSRATINRIEGGGKISSDIAFRIFYAMQKIRENIYVDNIIKEKSHILQRRIELNCILPKGKFNAITYSDK